MTTDRTDDRLTRYQMAADYFRGVSAAYREAEIEYRMRRIDDTQYLAARQCFDAASLALDAAESALLNMGPIGPTPGI